MSEVNGGQPELPDVSRPRCGREKNFGVSRPRSGREKNFEVSRPRSGREKNFRGVAPAQRADRRRPGRPGQMTTK